MTRFSRTVIGSILALLLCTFGLTPAFAGAKVTGPTPKIIGTAIVGETLNADPGIWAPAPVDLAFQWYRDGKKIRGAVSNTYTVQTADRGHRLRVKVTGSKTGYRTVTRKSAATARVVRARAVVVDTGYEHTCAVTSAGGVRCWGINNVGQLGDGTTTDSTVPVGVVGLAKGVASVSGGGYDNTCALTKAGGVKCWGRNSSGQLGDGTTTDSGVPVGVVGLSSGVASVSASNWYACALTKAGGVKCWGDNSVGELGDGTLTDSSVPVAVVGLSSGVASVSAGQWHTCAVTRNGRAKCWGSNGSGELGDGTTNDSNVPVTVTGLRSTVSSVSAGSEHTCALISHGRVRCWGMNYVGELGDGTTTSSSTPVAVVGF